MNQEGRSVVFMGSSDFAVPSLMALVDAGYGVELVVTRQDQPRGRGMQIASTPVKEAALELGLAVHQPKTLKSEAGRRPVMEARPDVVVVAAYGRFLPAEVLSLPRFGCVNVHPSMLPRYRGAAPIQWAIINGEVETGVTIMLLDDGMDSGPILSQEREPIHPDDTAATLESRLAKRGAELLVRSLGEYIAGRLEPQVQDHSHATFAPMLRKSDGRIDWSRDAIAVANLVRGTYPWPGAFTFLADGTMLKLHPPVETVDGVRDAAGKVVHVDRDSMVVACGRDALRVHRVQPAGKRIMTPRDLECGRRVHVGQVLGAKEA